MINLDDCGSWQRSACKADVLWQVRSGNKRFIFRTQGKLQLIDDCASRMQNEPGKLAAHPATRGREEGGGGDQRDEERGEAKEGELAGEEEGEEGKRRGKEREKKRLEKRGEV